MKEATTLARQICSSECMRWAIKTFQSFKTPAVNGILLVLLQKEQFRRSSLELGYIPEDWTRTNITFMPKVGKKRILDIRNLKNLLA